jgi:hypothetical protein
VEGLPKAEPKATKAADADDPDVPDDDQANVADRPASPDDMPPPMSPPDPMNLPSMPPMATPGSTETDPDTQPAAETTTPPKPEPKRENPPKAAAAPAAPPARAADGPFSDEDVIRSSEQFLTVLRNMGGRGGTLRIASAIDIEVPSLAIESPASNPVEILAEAGATRPRLRFRPSPMAGESPTDWTGIFHLRTGALRLQGLDLEVPEPTNGPADRLAAIAVSPGTELNVTDCTITVAVRRPTATAMFVTTATALPASSKAPAAAPATVIELRNAFVRSGGDAITVAGGAQLVLKLEDLMAAAEGSLLHALGSARAAAGSAVPEPLLNVRIERVSARLRGGLVYLQTTQERPIMASVDIRAADSILSTVTGDDPLFRLEGQDEIEALRDRIRWEAHKVAYHRIKTYRRDEIVQAGGLPRIYDRDDWTQAFRPTDEAPNLTDLKFRHQADAATPAWKLERDDLRPRSNSTSSPIGPDADKVPEPPADEEF